MLEKCDGKKAAFLIQNMFPVILKYIDHIHTKNGNPVPVNPVSGGCFPDREGTETAGSPESGN